MKKEEKENANAAKAEKQTEAVKEPTMVEVNTADTEKKEKNMKTNDLGNKTKNENIEQNEEVSSKQEIINLSQFRIINQKESKPPRGRLPIKSALPSFYPTFLHYLSTHKEQFEFLKLLDENNCVNAECRDVAEYDSRFEKNTCFTFELPRKGGRPFYLYFSSFVARLENIPKQFQNTPEAKQLNDQLTKLYHQFLQKVFPTYYRCLFARTYSVVKDKFISVYGKRYDIDQLANLNHPAVDHIRIDAVKNLKEALARVGLKFDRTEEGHDQYEDFKNNFFKSYEEAISFLEGLHCDANYFELSEDWIGPRKVELEKKEKPTRQNKITVLNRNPLGPKEGYAYVQYQESFEDYRTTTGNLRVQRATTDFSPARWLSKHIGDDVVKQLQQFLTKNGYITTTNQTVNLCKNIVPYKKSEDAKKNEDAYVLTFKANDKGDEIEIIISPFRITIKGIGSQDFSGDTKLSRFFYSFMKRGIGEDYCVALCLHILGQCCKKGFYAEKLEGILEKAGLMYGGSKNRSSSSLEDIEEKGVKKFVPHLVQFNEDYYNYNVEDENEANDESE